MKIGFLGLGLMGLPMATNLVRKGFDVVGFDVQPERAAALAEAGGSRAGSAAAASEGVDALILMVLNVDQVRQILFDDGVLEKIKPGGTVIIMSTCPPSRLGEVAQRIEASGRQFLEAPVAGGSAGAQAGTLTVMAAGRPSAYEAVRAVLEGMGRRIFHVGELPGQGATVKAINQILTGVNLAAVAEGLGVGIRAGIDPDILLEIQSGSSAQSWMLCDRRTRFLADEPEISNVIDVFVKDLGIVSDIGRAVGARMPLTDAALDQYARASKEGDGRRDDSQILRTYLRD
ncbi:NAD(P)-dependent oxidoreductase [Xanthobacteraceae bacterium A53D]